MSLIDRVRRLFGGGPVTPIPGDAEGMASCEEALAVMQEFLDGELDHLTHAQVKAHFDVCSRCYPHLRLEESFRVAVQRAARGNTAPPELKNRLKELLAEADPG